MLTLCVPTYKRNEELEHCLNSLLEQENLHTIVSEIIISDNNPQNILTDSLLKLIKQNKIITYTKNRENIGCHPNFLKLLLSAKTEWILFVSDDDAFENTYSLTKIYESIKSNSDISLFFSSRGYYENEQLKLISRFFIKSKKIFPDDYWSITRVLRNGYEFTGFCINKSMLNKFDIFSSVKLKYPQIYLATLVGLRGNSYYLDEPIFRHTVGNVVHWKINIDNTILSRVEIIKKISRKYPRFFSYGMLSLYEDVGYLLLTRLFNPRALIDTITIFEKNLLSIKNLHKLCFGFYSIIKQKILFQILK